MLTETLDQELLDTKQDFLELQQKFIQEKKDKQELTIMCETLTEQLKESDVLIKDLQNMLYSSQRMCDTLAKDLEEYLGDKVVTTGLTLRERIKKILRGGK